MFFIKTDQKNACAEHAPPAHLLHSFNKHQKGHMGSFFQKKGKRGFLINQSSTGSFGLIVCPKKEKRGLSITAGLPIR